MMLGVPPNTHRRTPSCVTVVPAGLAISYPAGVVGKVELNGAHTSWHLDGVVRHAPPYMPKYRPLRPSYVHPLNPVRNHVYGNTEAFADVVVEVPAGSDAAVVSRNPSPRRPPRWMPYWRAAVIGGPTLVLVGAVDHIGPMGPMAAAIWLGANWWLH